MKKQNESNLWIEYITPFAEAISKDVATVEQDLKSTIGEPGEEAIRYLTDPNLTPTEDLMAVFSTVPRAILKEAINNLLRKKNNPEISVTLGSGLLPTLPDDESWLTALKANGELKVDQSTVIAGVRASCAHWAKLFDVPVILVQKMESHSTTIQEPVSKDFFKLRKMLVRRTYGDLFAAIDGLDGTFITEKRRDDFLAKIDSNLWSALSSFNQALSAWVQSWQSSMNPAMMLLAVSNPEALPSGMMAPPPTDHLKDEAERVIDTINSIFSGIGIPSAMALAYDAKSIKDVLSSPELPYQTGHSNKEHMLRDLGLALTADYVRLEQNLTQFVLGVMALPQQTAATELSYLTALNLLGSQISWDTLRNKTGGKALKTSRDVFAAAAANAGY